MVPQNEDGPVSCCKQSPQNSGPPVNRDSPLGRDGREFHQRQLFPKFPDLEAPGNTLFPKSVETCFVAV